MKKRKKTTKRTKEIPEKCEPCSGARIEIAREPKGEDKWEYHWLLFAQNGKKLATNAVAYKRLNDLKAALESLEEVLPDAETVRLY